MYTDSGITKNKNRVSEAWDCLVYWHKRLLIFHTQCDDPSEVGTWSPNAFIKMFQCGPKMWSIF